ncbi:MAG: antitoxin [Oscillospiraceae bacterium]|nr:antitoxin [Oscillospiraceae bacterium]
MPNDNPTYRAIEKYKKKAYDRIELLVYKGEKQKIKEYATKKGKTVNGFITELIRNEMKEDK